MDLKKKNQFLAIACVEMKYHTLRQLYHQFCSSLFFIIYNFKMTFSMSGVRRVHTHTHTHAFRQQPPRTRPRAASRHPRVAAFCPVVGFAGSHLFTAVTRKTEPGLMALVPPFATLSQPRSGLLFVIRKKVLEEPLAHPILTIKSLWKKVI